MKQSYSLKLTVSFCIILAVFSLGIVIFEQYREKEYRAKVMEDHLDDFAGIVYKYAVLYPNNIETGLDSLLKLLPDNMRLTLVNGNGKIMYDNLLDETDLENHTGRPEIIQAKQNGKGSDIRMSATNDREYFYYAHYQGGFYTRVALPYDTELQLSLEPDNGFIYYVLALFLVGIIFIYYVSARFGKIIRQLRDFSYNVSQKGADINTPRFPDDELGEIGAQIANEYRNLKESEMKLAQEREKLLQHVRSSAEGVCFFTPDMQVAFHNNLFLQYLNIIGDHAAEPSDVLTDPVFRQIYDEAAAQTGRKRFENKFGRE